MHINVGNHIHIRLVSHCFHWSGNCNAKHYALWDETRKCYAVHQASSAKSAEELREFLDGG